MKLDSEEGLLVGHEACTDFIMGQVVKLLGEPAVLDADAQNFHFSEVSPVCTKEDNKALKDSPEKDEMR